MGDNDIKTLPTSDFEEKLEEISAQHQSSGISTLQDLEDMAKEMLNTLPRLDRNAIRQEMVDMEVPMFQTPTTFDINKGLAISQGYKDRLVEILSLATREYRLRKRCLEMLFDAVNVLSKASSSDKRKGEATMKYPILMLQTEAAETFVKEVEQFLLNIRNASESISRQGSLIQSQINLGEYRKRMPDMTSNNSEAEEWDYQSGAPKLNLDWDEVK